MDPLDRDHFRRRSPSVDDKRSPRENIEFDRFGREIVHLDLETWVHPTCGKTLIFPEGEVPSFCRYCNRDIEALYMVELNENLYHLNVICESEKEGSWCTSSDGWLYLIMWLFFWFGCMFMGGYIFNSLEEPYYLSQKQIYEDAVEKMKNSINNDTQFAAIMELAENYHNLPRHNIWQFEGATFFSVTVATTVGYGSHAPQTPDGKLAFMFFSVISISITAMTVRQLLLVVARCFRKSEQYFYKESRLTFHQVHFLWMCFTTVLLILIFIWQGHVYAYHNQWSTLNATYFLWTTFTTVGIGDQIPQEFLKEEGVAECALPLLIAIAFLPVWMWSVFNWLYILFIKVTFRGKRPLPELLEEAGVRYLENGRVEKTSSSQGRDSWNTRDSKILPLGNSREYFESNPDAEYGTKQSDLRKLNRQSKKWKCKTRTSGCDHSEHLLGSGSRQPESSTSSHRKRDLRVTNQSRYTQQNQYNRF